MFNTRRRLRWKSHTGRCTFVGRDIAQAAHPDDRYRLRGRRRCEYFPRPAQRFTVYPLRARYAPVVSPVEAPGKRATGDMDRSAEARWARMAAPRALRRGARRRQRRRTMSGFMADPAGKFWGTEKDGRELDLLTLEQAVGDIYEQGPVAVRAQRRGYGRRRPPGNLLAYRAATRRPRGRGRRARSGQRGVLRTNVRGRNRERACPPRAGGSVAFTRVASVRNRQRQPDGTRRGRAERQRGHRPRGYTR